MRVLLDENLPHKLRGHLSRHETVTASYAGLVGHKNGALLKAAEDAGFDVLVTGDTTLRYEQNLTSRKLAIVCLSANSWRIIQRHTDKIAAAVDAAVPGSFTTVDCGVFARRAKPPSPDLA
jgi:hypothetical protein